eukprot:scaffold23199_cov17-Tisochrysis_lutea.AAC.1
MQGHSSTGLRSIAAGGWSGRQPSRQGWLHATAHGQSSKYCIYLHRQQSQLHSLILFFQQDLLSYTLAVHSALLCVASLAWVADLHTWSCVE